MQYHSTRSCKNMVDSAQAVLSGLAPDGGLYVPQTLPQVDVEAVLAMDTYGMAATIIGAMLPDIPDMQSLVSRAYTGKGKISARPEQLFFSETGMPGKVLFSTFLGDFIEYEVVLDNGQTLLVNEYTKDTAAVHEDGKRVHLSFDPNRISLYVAETGEVLSK